MTPTSSVRVRDLEVCFAHDGPEDAPHLMLAHGILSSHRMWDGFVAALTQSWRVLRYDLRGHGGTSVTAPPYTMEMLAADAVGLLDALGIERIHLLGSSLGGMIGQQVGARYGHRLHSLTLANTSAVQAAPDAWAQRIVTARDQGVAPLVEATLQRWFTEGFFAGSSPAIERMRQQALATDAAGFIGCASAVRDLSQAGLLGDIRVPTLVIAGAQDRATPPSVSRFIQQRIAGAELVMLPAAHQSAVECPQEFARVWECFSTEIKTGDKP